MTSDGAGELRVVTEAEVAEAAAQLKAAEQAFAPVRARWQELHGQKLRLERRIQRSHRRVRRYEQLTRWLFPEGWCVIAGAAAWGMVTLAALFAGMSFLAAAGAGIAAAAVAVLTTALWFRKTARVLADRADAEATLPLVTSAIDALRPHYEELERKYREAEQAYQRILRQYNSAINQLLRTPWDILSGREFEEFIAQILRMHGYQAQLTTLSSDQGADLLVVAPDGRRIAIEAKGYPSGNRVGNEVVLKAIGGASYWGCTHAAVITNSYFTRQAEEAARRTGTILIDRDRLPDLITGRLRL